MQVQGLLFDAYGTLFDVHSVVEAGRAVTSDPAGAVGALAPEAARVHVAPEPHGPLRGLLEPSPNRRSSSRAGAWASSRARPSGAA